MFAALAALLLAGCATTPKTPPVTEKTRVINQSFDKVWGAVVATASGKYSLQVIEKQSGVLETQHAALSRADMKRYADSQRGLLLPLWTNERVKLSFYAREAEPGKTSVRVKASFEAFEYNATSTWFVWFSKGVLEDELLDAINQQIL
jgi:hypothetical protein